MTVFDITHPTPPFLPAHPKSACNLAATSMWPSLFFAVHIYFAILPRILSRKYVVLEVPFFSTLYAGSQGTIVLTSCANFLHHNFLNSFL